MINLMKILLVGLLTILMVGCVTMTQDNSDPLPPKPTINPIKYSGLVCFEPSDAVQLFSYVKQLERR